MAKTALVNRERKRRATVKKFAARRAELRAIINNSKASDEERMEAREKFQRLPRNSSPVRLRNRCSLTGRPRGCSASSVWAAASCAKSPCVARFPA